MDDETRPVAELIAAANQGQADAWNAIVARYAALVWSVCRTYRLSDAEASDVSQTVWLRLVEHLSTIRVAAALPGWLKTTTRNECLRVLALNRRTPILIDETTFLDDHESQAPIDAELLAAERRALVRECLAQLPPGCRALLVALSRDDNSSYNDISVELSMPIGSIGPTRQRCLHKLRSCPAMRRWADLNDFDPGGDANV